MGSQELGAYQTPIVSELLTELYGVDAKQAGSTNEDMLRSIKDAASVAFLGTSCIHGLHNIFDADEKSSRWLGYSNTDLPFSTLRFPKMSYADYLCTGDIRSVYASFLWRPE